MGTPRCISQVAAVWRDPTRKMGKPHSRSKSLLDRRHRLAVELNKTVGNQLAVPPAAEVSKQPRWDGGRRLAFFAGPLADRLAIEDAALKIDVRSAELCKGRRCGNRASPSASVNADQNESSNVSQGPAVCAYRVTL